MDECSLPKARPILCNESPAFQRHHMSLFCAAESPNRFPWVINTTFGEKTYIRWCCNDRLSSQRLSDGMRRPVSAGCDTLPMFDVLEAQRKGDRQCRRLALCGQGEVKFSTGASSRLAWI